MRNFSRALRTFSAIILFFFCWTFVPLWQVAAWGAAPEARKSEGRSKESEGTQQKTTAGDRFEKALEEIREKVGKAEEKSTRGEDDSAEWDAIKAKKSEIETLDGEFRNEFSATEKKLKDAKLPQEILDRHAAFVKNYEGNFNELKTNLDDVEKAKTSSERAAKIRKVNAHLERAKAPSRHQKLDPENLPFRTRKATKTREPRTKKEEFEKDFPPQRTPRMAELQRLLTPSRLTSHSSPVLLAYNDIASDIPFQLPRPSGERTEVRGGQDTVPFSVNDFIPQFAISNSQFMVASVPADLPTTDDLAETPEVQFTEDIKALAAQLKYKPVKIYEYVRNNIEFVPTYGSIQGAQMTLETKTGNAFDTASLLIALLRASGISARYVYSTVEIPIERAMNWVGGVTDPKMVGTILATSGVPVTLTRTSGGTYKAVQLEHVFVKAFIDMIPSRGAVHKQGDTWVYLDSSYKQYDFKRGMDLYTAMGINGEQYLQDYITDSSSLTIPAELQASFPSYTISPYQYYSKRLFNYLDANFPSATYQDVFGADTIEASRTIIKKEYPYLLGTLPYKVIAEAGTYTSLSDSLKHTVSFSIANTTSGTSLSYTTTLAETAGKRITLSYDPATANDTLLVSTYGTLLSVPPYLINVKPVLKINGVIVGTGGSVGLGWEQTFNMTFTVPNIGTEIVANTVIAGDYSAIALISNKVPATLSGDKMGTLINNIGSSDLDDLLGQMLYVVGVSYFHHLNFEEDLYAENFQMLVVKGISEAMITSHADVKTLFGVPRGISEGGIGIDVDKNEYLPFSYDGNQNRARDFMLVSGLGSSAWEDRVLQTFYDVPSVSAARLLRYANQQGVPVYTIDGDNIAITLTQIQLPSTVTDDIRNAVHAGKKVIVSKTSVQYEGWNGMGYIVLDPITGAAGYMISSGMAGGMGTRQPATSVRSVSQYFWGDGSALKTIVSRAMILLLALYELDTPYLWGGINPECGVDCSGFIHYLFTTTYGKDIFSDHLSVSGQYNELKSKRWTHPYEEKLDGDILWNAGYGHTGIYYGIAIMGTFNTEDAVIHASGKPCAGGVVPPAQCIQNPTNTTPTCGHFHRVVITSVNNAYFSENGALAPYIGRPLPDMLPTAISQ